jgi:hypothetical protein
MNFVDVTPWSCRAFVIHAMGNPAVGNDLRWRSRSDYRASCANPFQSKVMP